MPSLSQSRRIIQQSSIRKIWNQIDTSPKHGVCVPLFSLYTQESCGIGEFLDLIPMIDWCISCGFQILQILPINDTGSCSSPYNSISSIALNPLHLSISALPIKKKCQLRKHAYEKCSNSLNFLKYIMKKFAL